MMTKHDISKLETHKFWQGSHTKHIVEVLGWDGTVTSGGVVFTKRDVPGQPYPEYRLPNLVDILQAYNPVPNFPHLESLWVNEYDKRFVVLAIHGEGDNAWIIFHPDNVTGDLSNAMLWKNFRQLYKEA